MKKAICLLLCCLLMLTCVGCGGSKKEAKDAVGGYKDYVWGTSIDQITSAEGTPVSVKNVTSPASSLMDEMNFYDAVYNVNEYGQDFELTYSFVDGKLYIVEYRATYNGDLPSFLEIYNNVKGAMTKEFGKPYMDGVNWLDESMEKEYAKKKDEALGLGYMEYEVVYHRAEDTQIKLTAGCKNNGFYLEIEHYDLDWSKRQ